MCVTHLVPFLTLMPCMQRKTAGYIQVYVQDDAQGTVVPMSAKTHIHTVVACFPKGRVPRINHAVKEGLSRSRHLIQGSTTGNTINVFRVSVSL